MRKITKVLSLLTLTAFLGLPSFAAIEAQATAVRSQVIGDSLSLAYAEEKGEVQSVMVYIEDINQEAVRSRVSTSEPTAITLSSVPEEYPNQYEIEAKQAEIMALRNASKEAYLKQNTAFAEKYLDGKVEYISKYSPVIIASLDSADANRLALNSGVESIELYETDVVADAPEEEPMEAPRATTAGTDYLGRIQANEVHEAGYTGEGIKIGILEFELPLIEHRDDLGLTSTYCYNQTQADATIDQDNAYHASFVAYTLKSVAPNAQLYMAHRSTSNPSSLTTQNMPILEPIEWLIEQGVNIINISGSLNSGTLENPVKNLYSIYAKWLDHIALTHFVSIVTASGNDAESDPGRLCDGQLSYNSIIVGAVTISGHIAPFSSYTPMTFSEGSRPDICAPAVHIKPEGITSDWDSGTSYAAPQVAGAVALMCQQDAELLMYPETVKSLLAASVSDYFDNTAVDRTFITSPANDDNLYTKYGAGILDCLNTSKAIDDIQYVYCEYFGKNANGYTTNGQTKVYHINLQANKTTRIALSYLRCAEYNHFSHNLTSYTAPNISFSVQHNGVYYAQSSDYVGNLKIIEFTPTEEGTYTIMVTNNRSISADTWFSFAWYQYDN